MKNLGLFTVLVALATASAGCAMSAVDNEDAAPSVGEPSDRKGTSEVGEVALAVARRTLWQTERIGFFKQVRGRTWLEEGAGGTTYFNETQRTPEYIELHDPRRNLYMRLYDDHAKYRKGDRGPWRLFQYRGRWVR
ncbi:hypothetical protein [Sorangium sp. So ce426]|uniref:hypothetical protein n=1 Tax=Sorangium sp. So ce426 TaxID=3133312 RepID=UPI003F5B2394